MRINVETYQLHLWKLKICNWRVSIIKLKIGNYSKIYRMKILLITLGSLSLVLGVIGIFIPLLPTTPLLLLSAWCYFRSSEKLYLKLINSKHLGTYIKNFRENKVIPIKTKIYIITLLWISLIYCIFFVANGILWLQIILAIILIGVTLHILSYKS